MDGGTGRVGADLIGPSEGVQVKPDYDLADFRQLRDEFTRFMMQYRFGIDEVTTKLSILRDEFTHLHEYNPIEHITSRLKSPESIVAKVQRRGCDPSFAAIRAAITDIAGVRVICSFLSDVPRVFDLLANQRDVRVLDVKDYIANPKPNGYRSLHGLIEIPVFLSDSVVPVVVEVQLRTMAMDFWASLEHKIYYKYNRTVPAELLAELAEAAETASRLDTTMRTLHEQIRGIAPGESGSPLQGKVVPSDEVLRQFWRARHGFVNRAQDSSPAIS